VIWLWSALGSRIPYNCHVGCDLNLRFYESSATCVVASPVIFKGAGIVKDDTVQIPINITHNSW